jgi:tellurite resistance protein TerC
VVLAFVGVKMLLGHTEWKIPTLLSLGIVVGILAVSVIASLLRPRKTEAKLPAAVPQASR